VLWSGECEGVFGMREPVKSPLMTFPLKKIGNTVLFIDRMATLYIEDTLIRVVTNEGDQGVDTS